MATHEEIVKAGQIIAQGIEDGILNAPIIDIVVRKKGEWLNEYEMKCSICGFECDDPYYLGEANYCPNCGAEMRGDEDD